MICQSDLRDMTHYLSTVTLALWCLTQLAMGQDASKSNPVLQTEVPPKSPADGLAAWKVREGYRIELVAAEPLVADPVAIDWGPDGHLWVAEMADYPLGMDGKGEPGGRIRFLEDTNGDGKYDASTVFLGDVRFPTGVMAWRDGVLITAAPEIFYAEDTDGDGRADRRQTLYRGFPEDNQQLRVNGLRWGLDNWIYCASGSPSSGRNRDTGILSVAKNQRIELGARDFRFRPDEGLLDPQSGPSQFGRCRNDWGDWFGVQNIHPVWHYVLADHYTRRNQHYAPPDPRRDLYTPHNPRIFAAKTPQKRFHGFDQIGHFTSACGIGIYRDELLFARGNGDHSFTCEPFSNIVHHAVLHRDGVSFVARRDEAEETSEFLASTDRWCRPVMARTGPDGALWVVDIYRYMIEHPDFLPEHGQNELRPFFRSGDDRGRIYRVVPERTAPRVFPKLEDLDTGATVALLESPNGPVRDMAQRQLIDRREKKAVAALKRLAAGSRLPLARLHALCTLDGLGSLTPKVLRAALTDPHPALRKHALRLSESRATPELIGDCVDLWRDPDATVLLQLANTLGEWQDSRAASALGHLVATRSGDPYMVAAVMSSIRSHNIGSVVEAVLGSDGEARDSEDLVESLSRLAVVLGPEGLVTDVVSRATTPQENGFVQWQFVALASALQTMGDAVSATPVRLDDGPTGDAIEGAIAHARRLSMDAEAPDGLRSVAIRLLLREPERRQEDYATLAGLLSHHTSPEVQVSAVERLAQQTDVAVADILLQFWSSYGPARRNQVLSVLTRRKEWTKQVLTRLTSGEISVGEINASARRRFLAHQGEKWSIRLQGLFNAGMDQDRRKVLAAFQKSLDLQGVPENGVAVFKKKCANCHKYRGLGVEAGPDLATLTHKTPEALLEAIIDPNRAVENKYLSYVALTKDGRALTGILALETATSITILESEGKRHILLRTDLAELQSSGKSLMPDGLEQDLSPQNMADLISFIAVGDP